MSLFAALSRIGSRLLGAEEATPLQQLQLHLARKEAAAAWEIGQTLLVEALAPDQKVEALACLGVAAAATGRLAEANRLLQNAKEFADQCGFAAASAGAGALAERAHHLQEQGLGRRDLLCGPLWCPDVPEPPQVPTAWAFWAAAMPRVAEYVGPVKVKWVGDPARQQRGLFASRHVKAGEVLLVGLPLGQAEANGAPLIAALQRQCRVSGLARRRLMCLADGSSKTPLPPEAVMEALYAVPDEPPEALVEGEDPAHGLNLKGIIDANVMSMKGWAGLYGLGSILNHSCDGRSANALKLVLTFLDGAIVFAAARDIEEGEELCHRYFDVEGSVKTRRETSAAWHFECQCRRCVFEAEQLPGTLAAATVAEAVETFKSRLRQELKSLADPNSGPGKLTRAALIGELLGLVDKVEDACAAQSGWGQAELGWCMALVQPISNAALWCLLTFRRRLGAAAGGSSGVEEDNELSEPEILAYRCKVLERIVIAWENMESFGFDHLRNLHLLFSAKDEVRIRAVAEAALEASRRPVIRDGLQWPRVLQREEFLASVGDVGLEDVVQKAGGILRVPDFLPVELAEEVLASLAGLPEEDWLLSAQEKAADAVHRFWRYEGKKVDASKRLIYSLSPGKHPIINAARYDAGGQITLHNDAMQWVVKPHEEVYQEFPAGTTVYRKVACILYLTKDWKEEHGGCFVDNLKSGPRVVVPQFNNLVLFNVPREHWVTEMQPGAPLRYTIFGWLCDLEPYPPGLLQPLGSGNASSSEEGPGAHEGVATPETAAAARAKENCERAFFVRFGIRAQDLGLGTSVPMATALLRRLEGGT